MNLADVSKREILDFKQFRSRVMDDTFKSNAPEVQDPLSGDKTGLFNIKRQPAFDYIGYANSIWSPDKAGITVPGYNANDDRSYVNGVGFVPQQNATFKTNESNEIDLDDTQEFKVSKIENF
jgi:hypothetical protein